MNLKEMRDKRVAAKDRMQAILDKAKAENRLQLNEEEDKAYKEAKAEFVALGEAIEREEEVQAFDAELEEPSREAYARNQAIGRAAPEAKKEFGSFGEFVHAVAASKTGRGTGDQRLEYGSPSREAAMSGNVGEDGGYMIPDQFRAELQRVEPEEGPLFSRCTVLPAGTPPDAALTFPIMRQTSSLYGGIDFEELDVEPEADLPEMGSPKIDLLKLQPKAFGGTVPIPNNLLVNWAASETFLQTLFRASRAHYFEKRIASGNGINQMLGYLSADNGALKKVNRALANKFSFEDLTEMEAEIVGPNQFWRVQKKAIPQLRQMKDAAGNLIYQENGNAQSGGLPTLLGRPVVLDDRSPALGALGDVCLLSMGAYWIKLGSGPFIDVSEHVDFKRNRTVFRVIESVDGQPSMKGPIVGEGDSNTYSPFVALDVPE